MAITAALLFLFFIGLPVATCSLIFHPSGVMAGMMGAMFADMIPPEQHLLLLRILCVLAGSIFFLLLLMILGELKQEFRYKMPFVFRAPAWVFLVVAFGGMGLSYMELSNVNCKY